MPDVCCNLIWHEAVKHIIIPPKYAQLLEFVSSILVEWLRGYYVLLAVLVMKPNWQIGTLGCLAWLVRYVPSHCGLLFCFRLLRLFGGLHPVAVSMESFFVKDGLLSYE